MIRNQSRAMQARVNAESNFIVNKIIKENNLKKKNEVEYFGSDNERDELVQQIQ